MINNHSKEIQMTKKLWRLPLLCTLVVPVLGCGGTPENKVIVPDQAAQEAYESYGQPAPDQYKGRASGSRSIPKS